MNRLRNLLAQFRNWLSRRFTRRRPVAATVQPIPLSKSAEGALIAAAKRHVRHVSRSSYRRNSRGLPVGVAVHQLNRAKALKKRLASKQDDGIIGDTRLNDAETVLDAVKRNSRARAAYRRPSKLARRVAALA